MVHYASVKTHNANRMSHDSDGTMVVQFQLYIPPGLHEYRSDYSDSLIFDLYRPREQSRVS